MRDAKTLVHVQTAAPAAPARLPPDPLTLNPPATPSLPIERARPDEARRLQQIRRAQAFREAAAARRWSLTGMASCLACLAGAVLWPSLWPIWLLGALMGATAAMLGRATRREALAAAQRAPGAAD